METLRLAESIYSSSGGETENETPNCKLCLFVQKKEEKNTKEVRERLRSKCPTEEEDFFSRF